MARRPLQIAVASLLVGALGFLGIFRFGIDAGQSLLVGSNSSAGQTYAAFAQTFGSDPIVLVFSARNPTAPYIEQNLERLGALEIDLAHDPRVASVLGPGTIAGSLRQAAVAEESRLLVEYPYFVAETAYQQSVARGTKDQTKLTQLFQNTYNAALLALDSSVLKAATDAHIARAQYKQKAGDRVIDSREKAVDAAVSHDATPPFWAIYYSANPQPTQAQTAAAQQFFDRVTAAYGDCDDQIASALKVQPTCQVFFERTLLDLPNCPPVNSQSFCAPKPQWAAVLPAAQPGAELIAIITIRVKPQYVGDQAAISSLQDKVNNELAHGIQADAYTHSLSASSVSALRSLGPLAPTECGGQTAQQDAACVSAFHDAPLSMVIAGAPLLGLGVVNAMSRLLLILVPVALFVMLLLLIAVFRVRGRVWPLLAAAAATVLTVGVGLLTGTPITPAVLAGVPVLVGLGVDYAVQLVARFSEERSHSVDVEEALRRVLSNTGGATLVAALATLVGLAALAAVSGIDWGPLVAVPLVAEFALVLCGGVVLAWLGSLFIALPLAVWSDSRSPIVAAEQHDGAPAASPAPRTVAIADNWRGVLVPATVLALAGWLALHVVPVQTDVQSLLAPSLPELSNIETVQAETGYTNEVDVYVRGQVVTGPVDPASGLPQNVEWQCGAASVIRSEHGDQVAQATSIGDYVIASGSSSSGNAAAPCVPSGSAPAPTPSPAPSPSASTSPSASSSTATPSAARMTAGAVLAAEVLAHEAATTLSPSASPAASPSPATSSTPVPTPVAGGSPTPAPSANKPTTQTPFLCDLRLFPLLSRTLVMPIGPDTTACPPVDEYFQQFITSDSTPVDPTASRIAIGVHTDTVAQQAQLVDGLQRDVANPPNGMTATPTGLAVLATTAYDNLTNRAYLLNVAPLVVVAIVLFALYREPRRALLPLVPTALAAGWGPLLLLALGRLPGGWGSTLGSLNPLTVVLGALVVALGTEFGVVLLGRFYEERRRGLDPDAAAGAALSGVGRAIRVSALTLGAGFGVLALSGFFPNSLPLVADFGLAVVLDLALAVVAVFLVMLPLAVVLERHRPLRMGVAAEAVPAAAAETAAIPEVPRWEPAAETEPEAEPEAVTIAADADSEETEPEPVAEAEPAPAPSAPAPRDGGPPRRLPGVSGRRRSPAPDAAKPDATGDKAHGDAPPPKRRPGVSGRPRRRR